VRYENDPWASVDVTLGGSYPVRMALTATGVSLNMLFSRAPPTFALTSYSSDVIVEDHFGFTSTLALASAPRGNLELLAEQSVRLELPSVVMDEIAPAYLRDALHPITTLGDNADIGPSDLSNNQQQGFTPIHLGDPDPVRIYAVNGSVCAQVGPLCTLDSTRLPAVVTLPKPLELVAGVDVFTGDFRLQNNAADDLSLIVAGRDLFQPIAEVRGTGSLLIQAGRDVVLNQSPRASDRSLYGDVYSLGDRTTLSRQTINLALSPNRGADIYILAGAAQGVNWDGFAAVYLDPANAHGVPRTYLPELASYMEGLGYGRMAEPDLTAAFSALPLARREIFLDQVYLTELRQTGIDYNDQTSPRYLSYNRGFEAISLLFPGGASTTGGSVSLNGKPLETQSGGSITVLAPYGSVEVGTDVLPPGVDPSAGGIVTRRGGDIGIMTNGNIDLFTSRVFTLEGGDVLMWTSNGSITAGFGAKTSVFQKPLAYAIDPAAVVSVDAFGLQTGAGIGVLDALQGKGPRKRSRLDLIAPRGEVNAGDAGIRVVGDINIAAAVVVGVENIQFSGKATGVPKVEVPNVAALTSASQLAQAASQQGVGPEARARTQVTELPSIITVEVVGYETPATPEKQKDKKHKSVTQ